MSRQSPSRPADWRRTTLVVSIWLAIALLSAFSFLVLVAAYWPEGRVAALFVLRRTSTCTFPESLVSVKRAAAQHAATAEAEKTSHLVTTDPSGFELWETSLGRFWIIAGEDRESLFWELGEQASDIYTNGPMKIRKGDTVLDCGARYGTFTRKALQQGAGIVVAVDPNPQSMECLRRNFSRETKAGSVRLYPKGVWDTDDYLSLRINPQNSATSTFVLRNDEVGEEVKAPLTTIDALVKDLNLQKVDFIKMDIEGAETRALAGASNIIKRDRPRLAICVYHRAGDPIAVPEIVRRARQDYRMVRECRDWFDRIEPVVMYFY